MPHAVSGPYLPGGISTRGEIALDKRILCVEALQDWPFVELLMSTSRGAGARARQSAGQHHRSAARHLSAAACGH